MSAAEPAITFQSGPGGTRKVLVANPGSKFDLDWDQFEQLSNAARGVRQFLSEASVKNVLHVGNADGSLALFLPECDVFVGELDVSANESFDLIVCGDHIANIEPRRRGVLVAQMGRAAAHGCVVTFPLPSSSTAHKAVAALSGSQEIADRVKFGLPYSSTIRKFFEDMGFECSSWQHGARGLWVAFTALKACRHEELTQSVSRYLIEEQPEGAPLDPLFETLIARKRPPRQA